MARIKTALVVSLTTFVLGMCVFSSISQAESKPILTFTGEAASDFFGWSVSGAGDVNKDGFADLIVGALGYDSAGIQIGRAQVYSGQTGALLYTFTGEAAGDDFGRSVSGAGDVNNDGFADLIVGARLNDAAGNFAGRAYVYSGQTGELLYTFTGEASGDGFGVSVSGAGDVDGDGSADLIVGASRNDAINFNAGRAYVYSGQSGALLYTFTGEDRLDFFGESVSGAGDVNNDGHADLIVGAYGHSALGGFHEGRVYVYSGQNGALLYTLTGEAPVDRFGFSVSGAGDVNNDGFDDLIVGAPGYSAGGATGRVYVYSGQTGALLYTFTGSSALRLFGWSVSGAGEVNNDGYADLIVGTREELDRAGRAYVYSGKNGELLQTFTGEAIGDQFGTAVSGAGDINNDGLADLIVGALTNDAGGSNAGRAYVYADINCCDMPGDANSDERVNIADAQFVVSWLFSGGASPGCCEEGSANGDDKLNIADVTYVISWLFAGGPDPVCGPTGMGC